VEWSACSAVLCSEVEDEASELHCGPMVGAGHIHVANTHRVYAVGYMIHYLAVGLASIYVMATEAYAGHVKLSEMEDAIAWQNASSSLSSQKSDQHWQNYARTFQPP